MFRANQDPIDSRTCTDFDNIEIRQTKPATKLRLMSFLGLL